MLRPIAFILAHLWTWTVASAAPAGAPAWDQPFVVPPALADAMDSKTCPILRVVPIAREACLARLAQCMDAESIGTVWHMGGEHDRADRLSMLHLSIGGRPLAFRMEGGADPLMLDSDSPAATTRVVRASTEDGRWRLQVTTTPRRLAVETTYSGDEEAPRHRVVRQLTEVERLESYTLLQGATIRTMVSPERTPRSVPVTLLVGCSP